MKKAGLTYYIVLGILFLGVNILSFVLPTNKDADFFIGYVFTLIAFGVVAYVIYDRSKDSTMKKVFMGMPLMTLAGIYLVLQMILFFVLQSIPTLPSFIPIILYTVLLVFALIGMIASREIIKPILEVEEKVNKKVFYIKELEVDVQLLVGKESDPETKKALENLAKKIKYSDPMSSDQLLGLEERIKQNIETIKRETHRLPLVLETMELIDERNMKCKLLK